MNPKKATGRPGGKNYGFRKAKRRGYFGGWGGPGAVYWKGIERVLDFIIQRVGRY